MEKSLTIISSVNRFCEIEEFLNSIFSQLNLSRKMFCKIYLSVFEAVNNAIQHGNDYSIEKNVEILFFDEEKTLNFVIKDEGLGFDFNNLIDPTSSDNIKNESGRGIFFMKKYADEVLFTNKGSSVQLIFYKNSD